MSERIAMTPSGVTRVGEGVFAIDTGYLRPLADASHLLVAGGRAAFVDTGVNDSVPRLIEALGEQGLAPADVDFVFLTHVHLDHAGGAGRLMQALPAAQAVVHPRGAPHMLDPSKLVAGTEAVYGVEKARAMYGVIEPIDADRLRIAEDDEWIEFGGRRLEVIFTEGHARHHYVLNDPASCGVFTGDSFGISYRDFDTAAGEFIFPTTTPIDFDPDAAHLAIDRILACEPAHVYLTHYSRVTDLERLAADLHQDIDAFREMALDSEALPGRQQAIERAMFDYLAGRLTAHGFAGDREAMHALLAMDITLNSQGLSVWLDRTRKRREALNSTDDGRAQ